MFSYRFQLMGMESPAIYGGSEFSFMSTILAIEEIAKVDASVAALVDIHNTLVVRFFKIMGNEAQKEKYLKILSTEGVRILGFLKSYNRVYLTCVGGFLFLNIIIIVVYLIRLEVTAYRNQIPAPTPFP